MPRTSIALLFPLLVALGCASWTDEDRPIAQTSAGSVAGERDDGTLVFRSIPYAAPPTGELRFRPPEPPRAWGGVRDAIEFRDVCPQPTFGMIDFFDNLVERIGISWWRRTMFSLAGGLMSLPAGNEDCLTLSVWTPSLDATLPVLVWIHGGGHTAGSGSQQAALGVPYAQRDIVVVSINYRLGVFGYLAHPALIAESEHGSAGNYGTLDQIAALEWVRDNIAQFGGDPGRVTILGESAGAMSVAQLMASPLARGLFHSAISQSGTSAHQFLDLDEPRHNLAAATRSGELILEAIGEADAAHPAAVLRAASTERLQEAFARQSGELMYLLHPNVDGWLLEEPVARTFREGRQAPVPYIVGFNAGEGTLLQSISGPIWNGRAATTLSDWQDFVDQRFGNDAAAIAAMYPARDENEVITAAEAMLGDSLFGAPSLFAARAHAAAGYPTHLYFLTREPPSPTQTTGAYHAIELQYVFESPFPMFPWNDVDDALSQQMVGYWSAFVKQGAPHAEGQADWTAFDPANPRWMEFGDTIGMTESTRLGHYELMERHLIAPFIDEGAN
jgi:para-nitrobenzyl esterase